MQNILIYTVGGVVSTSQLLAQVSADHLSTSVWVQAGMAGIALVLMLKIIPMLMASHEKTNERSIEALKEQRVQFTESLSEQRKEFSDTLDKVSDAHRDQNKAWQQIVTDRGICKRTPADD